MIKHIEQCVECNKFKLSNASTAWNRLSPRIPERFEVLSMDLVGTFPIMAEGQVYIFMVMDVTTGFLEMLPMS